MSDVFWTANAIVGFVFCAIGEIMVLTVFTRDVLEWRSEVKSRKALRKGDER